MTEANELVFLSLITIAHVKADLAFPAYTFARARVASGQHKNVPFPATGNWLA